MEINKTKSLLVSLAVLGGFAMSPSMALATPLTSTLGTTVLTTAGGVGLVVYLVTKDDAEEEDKPGEKTARLMNLGILSTQTDLPMQLQLLQESPGAFAQLGQESRGEIGPATRALAQASGLSAERTQVLWAGALAQVGGTQSALDARRVVGHYTQSLAPELVVERELLAENLWRLARETQDPSFSVDSDDHAWLAAWLGVPVEAVMQSTQATFAGMDRAQIYQSPLALSQRLAQSIEADNCAAIDARVAALVAQYQAQVAL